MSPINTSAARTTGRLALPLLCIVAAGALAFGGPSVAQADCCLGGPEQPADFHARALNGAPVALKPVTTVQVSSEAPADYTAKVTISVGGRAIARTTRHGHSDTSWSQLRVPLTARQRHDISAVARHEQRRPIFGVQLRGTLGGKTHPSVHYIQLVMSVAGVKTPKTITDGADLITRISLTGQSVNGTSQHATGRIVIRTPKAGFERTGQDAAQTAHFKAQVGAGCRATVIVMGDPVASSVGAAAQARESLAGFYQLLTFGNAGGGLWTMSEYNILDDNGAPTGAKSLYGLAVTPLAAANRWMHLREIVRFSGACSDSDRRDSAFTKSLERILRTARVEAKLASGPATAPLSLPSP